MKDKVCVTAKFEMNNCKFEAGEVVALLKMPITCGAMGDMGAFIETAYGEGCVAAQKETEDGVWLEVRTKPKD